MIRDQIVRRGLRDPRILRAFESVPRHLFLPPELRSRAYWDEAVSIGLEQTISQPYVVAFMTDRLGIQPGDRVLEVGTGSGYQTAILAELGAEVFTIESVEPLALQARALLEDLGYQQIHFRVGDAFQGWPEAAPFDRILVAAAPPQVPQRLLDQLAEGGSLIIPIGDEEQDLRLFTRIQGKITVESVLPVRFVPMTGQAQKQSRKGPL